MLKFKSKLNTVKLDQAAYTKTLDKQLGIIIREAAREWLRAVITFAPSRGGFPVWSGMAKSTLKPLGRFLRVAVPVTPEEGAPDRRSMGEEDSSFEISDTNGKYTFAWSNTVFHYYLHEFGLVARNTEPKGPWQSIKHGERAMIRYVEQALVKKLPKVGKYIRFERSR